MGYRPRAETNTDSDRNSMPNKDDDEDTKKCQNSSMLKQWTPGHLTKAPLQVGLMTTRSASHAPGCAPIPSPQPGTELSTASIDPAVGQETISIRRRVLHSSGGLNITVHAGPNHSHTSTLTTAFPVLVVNNLTDARKKLTVVEL